MGCVASSRDTGRTWTQDEKRSTDRIWKSMDTQLNPLRDDKFFHYVSSPNVNMIYISHLPSTEAGTGLLNSVPWYSGEAFHTNPLQKCTKLSMLPNPKLFALAASA